VTAIRATDDAARSAASPAAEPPVVGAWKLAREPGHLGHGTIDVWLADLGAAAREASLAGLLSGEERARAGEILDPRTRGRWIAARALLRRLLGEYLVADPRALRFSTTEHGKPMLAGAPIEFNLSHSGHLAIFAFSAIGPVGVDVELREGREPRAIAARLLGASAARSLSALPPEQQQRELLRAWVRYEAVAKCSGLGIWQHEQPGQPGIWVRELEPGEAAAAALAARQAPLELRLHRFRV
jgi:4'-phosphopantetheinyl transferase